MSSSYGDVVREIAVDAHREIRKLASIGDQQEGLARGRLLAWAAALDVDGANEQVSREHGGIGSIESFRPIDLQGAYWDARGRAADRWKAGEAADAIAFVWCATLLTLAERVASCGTTSAEAAREAGSTFARKLKSTIELADDRPILPLRGELR